MNILEHLSKNYHLRTHFEKCDFLHFYGFYMFWKCVSGWVLIKNSYLKVIAMSSLGIEDDFCTISEPRIVPRREYTFIWNQMIFTHFLLILWSTSRQIGLKIHWSCHPPQKKSVLGGGLVFSKNILIYVLDDFHSFFYVNLKVKHTF